MNVGEAHELHKPEKESHPSIVVHIVGEEDEDKIGFDDEEMDDLRPKIIKIPQTKRPEI
jgi:hypothetical protein